jgi:tetratricopeptide (TPR) repeat protein
VASNRWQLFMFDKENFNIQETFKLAIKKHLNKNFKEAKKIYSEILKVKPDHANALNNLGEIFRIEGETKKAQICYEKAINVNPNSASFYNNLGLVYKSNKDKIKAIDLFIKSIKIDPNFANPNYNLGLIYKELGDYKNAKIFYEKVIKINSNHADTYNNLAIINEELGETQNAKKNYNKAIEINPKHINALWNSHILAFDIDEALSILRKINEIDKQKIESRIMIGALESYKGNFELYNNLLNSEHSDHPYMRSIKWIFSLSKLPKIFFNRWSFFDEMISLSDNSKPFYEFGVWNGVSFKYLIKTFKKGFGFDTFTGIPETWHNEPVGNYSNFGVVPNIEGGEFIVGKFEDTLPNFFLEKRPIASLINFDADLYSSTICALNFSKEIIDEKTILIFDEFIMNNNWEKDEYKALNEFCNNFDFNYEVLAFSLSTKQVAIKIKKN